MDVVLLSTFKSVRRGLEEMLTAAIGEHGYVCSYVDVSVALLIIEIAKRAEDKAEWFPHGKWATIQNMQSQCEKELSKLFAPTVESSGTP